MKRLGIKSLITLSVLAGVVLTAACNNSEKSFTLVQDNPVINVPSDSPFYVQISTTYEGGTIPKVQSQCHITPGLPVGTVLTTADCAVHIPEVDLYYSGMTITLGTNDSTTCDQISFRPFYWLRSTSATFIADGSATAIDCSGATGEPVPACYGGMGTNDTLFPNFPSSIGTYFLPGNQLAQSFTIASTNSLRILAANQDKQYLDNQYTSNTLSDPATPFAGYPTFTTANSASPAVAATPVGNNFTDFVGGANNYHDYQGVCLDPHGNILYAISWIIYADHTPTVPPVSQCTYWDWFIPFASATCG